MSKVITAPEKFEFTLTKGELKQKKFLRNPWRGTIVLKDPLYLPQAEVIESWVDGKDGDSITENLPRALPMLVECVESWNLENFPTSPTIENVPTSPTIGVNSLLSWIEGEILKIYYGELEIPNE